MNRRLTVEIEVPSIEDDGVKRIAEAVHRAAWDATRQEVEKGTGTVRVFSNAEPSLFALETGV